MPFILAEEVLLADGNYHMIYIDYVSPDYVTTRQFNTVRDVLIIKNLSQDVELTITIDGNDTVVAPETTETIAGSNFTSYDVTGRVYQVETFRTSVAAGAQKIGDTTLSNYLTVLETVPAQAEILAGDQAEFTVTVTGAVAGDTVTATPESIIEDGLVWDAYVSAADTVSVRLTNTTALGITPAEADWRIAVIQYSA